MFQECKSLKMNTSGPGFEWVIPEDADIDQECIDWNFAAFAESGGNVYSPVPGQTYYLASVPSIRLNSDGFATYSSYNNVRITTTGVKAYKATLKDKSLILTKLDACIPASTGVILYSKNGGGKTVTFTANDKIATNMEGNVLLPTTTSPCMIADSPHSGVTLTLSGKEFQAMKDDETFNHFEAYLNLEEGLLDTNEKLEIVFDDETGLDEMECVDNTSNTKHLAGNRIVIQKNRKKYTTFGQRIL